MKEEVKAFINQHKSKSVAEVALLISNKPSLPKEFILNQINGLQKARKKFPFLEKFSTYNFPAAKAVEQSSSEQSARHKTKLIKGESMIDLSGGMGVDSYFFSKNFSSVHYVEKDENLYKTTSDNFKHNLKASNVTAHHSTAEEFLENFDGRVDLIYIDPDRRVTKDRAFRIEECEPNVAHLLPLIHEKSNSCLIKLSPMLDVSQALGQLKYCKQVRIVAIKNECKELLFMLEYGFQEEPLIIAEELEGASSYEFTFSEEKESAIKLADPKSYLYEPSVALRKAGAFKTLANRFNIDKIAMNTHLYTSSEKVDNFPGRTLRVLQVVSPQKGIVAQANVIAKNFPLDVKAIRKKYKIRDGGEKYLYACSLSNGKNVFIVALKD